MTVTMTSSQAAVLARRILDEINTVVVGKSEPLRLVLAALLAGGHVLIEDFPGLGKTLAARAFAQALGLEFARAQFTPDLLPGDLTGAFIYNQKEGTFDFRKGPIFANLMLADEINRTPPKTQSALLEAMQEHQVTVEGKTFPLPQPFHVIATANPIEYEGTYPLPEAQLDRFLMRVSFGYPTVEEERSILRNRMARGREDVEVAPVVNGEELKMMQASLESVRVTDAVVGYCVDLVRATREHDNALIGSSPRGALALLSCSRAIAVIDSRDYVTPDDVKQIAQPVLAHRLRVKPQLWMTGLDGDSIVAEVLQVVPVPDVSVPDADTGLGSDAVEAAVGH
jgi:MoxR-like ATPase